MVWLLVSDAVSPVGVCVCVSCCFHTTAQPAVLSQPTCLLRSICNGKWQLVNKWPITFPSGSKENVIHPSSVREVYCISHLSAYPDTFGSFWKDENYIIVHFRLVFNMEAEKFNGLLSMKISPKEKAPDRHWDSWNEPDSPQNPNHVLWQHHDSVKQ